MEELYIGTKIIAAEPMDEVEFSMRVKPVAHTLEIGADGKGRLGYKVRYEDGYISWSPKETFERAYRKVTDSESVMIMEDALKRSAGIPIGHHFEPKEE